MRFVISCVTVTCLALLPTLGHAYANTDDASTLWVTLCSGGRIAIDLGGDNDDPMPPVNSKACHAVCCQRDVKSKCAEDDDNDNSKV